MLKIYDRRRSDESGSVLMTVLIVVLVLGLITVTLSSAIVNTTRTTMSVKGSLQAQAASDAGLADAYSAAITAGVDPCTVAKASTTEPRYRVNGTAAQDPAFSGFTACPDSSTVVFRSVGYGADGNKVVTDARYTMTRTAAAEPTTGADMIFFSDATFTKQVQSGSADGSLLSIIVPSGNFTCQVGIPANITVAGNFTSQGSCTVEGNVWAGGRAYLSNQPDLIKGNLTASSNAAMDLQGMVNGDISVGGALNFGWSSRTYPGNVRVGGSVNLSNVSIGKTLTIPSSEKVQKDGYIDIKSPSTDPRINGGIRWQSSVPAPAPPSFDPWFEYKYKSSDWPGYTVKTLATSGDGQWTCNRFNANNPSTGNAAGWRELADLTSPTIIDARACSTLTSNNGSNPSVAIKTNIVFLAKSYNLNQLTMTTTDATTRNLWVIVEDPTADGKPTCANGAGDVTLISGVFKGSLRGMVYTPCNISPNGGEWRGAFYGGGFVYGGGMKFTGIPIGLPGQGVAGSPGSGGPGTVTYTLGDLQSRRDVG
jgi:Tfp pilus assembly protein PilX